MTTNEFYRQLKHNLNFVTFGDGFIIYKKHKGPKKTFEFYNIFTRESVYLPWDELLKYEFKGKTVESYIEDLKDLNIKFEGGNGQSSERHSVFSSASMGEGANTPDLPARMNKLYNGNKMSQEHTLETFREKHAAAKSESAIIMDSNGFVSVYEHGGSHSVGIDPAKAKGKHVIHNHPSGSHFSGADMEAFASTGVKAVTATGTKATYTVTKTAKFDANGFSKAIANAKTTSTDYDKGVHDFLSKASKKYGFIYERKVY